MCVGHVDDALITRCCRGNFVNTMYLRNSYMEKNNNNNHTHTHTQTKKKGGRGEWGHVLERQLVISDLDIHRNKK